MLVAGIPHRTVWLEAEEESVGIIDQRALPFAFTIEIFRSTSDACRAISEMRVRGAGCIGATAGYGLFLAARECWEAGLSGADFDLALARKSDLLRATRPTAVNLAWALDRVARETRKVSDAAEKVRIARQTANEIADEDAEFCRRIGDHGLDLFREIHAAKVTKAVKGQGNTVNVLTHCNAGWLAFVDYGSATAPIYAAHRAGIPVHVWVDETRPRNQGARLTAWELAQEGVPHTVIADNVGGHLMQKGLVDLVITGTDRTTRTGDVANKIGTYLKALAARDNGVPFYVALPSSTFDWTISDGVNEIPIEQRGGAEVSTIAGLLGEHEVTVNLVAKGTPVANFAFDVTPARLVTALITERGLCPATESGILSLFSEHRTLDSPL